MARYATSKGWLTPADAAIAVGRLSDDLQNYPSWVPDNERHKLLWLVRAASMAVGSYTPIEGEHTESVRAAQVEALYSKRRGRF